MRVSVRTQINRTFPANGEESTHYHIVRSAEEAKIAFTLTLRVTLLIGLH